MNNNTNLAKIESFQALRTLAFLGIFFSHASFYVKWPKLGVSVFFVLSGFLLVYTRQGKELNASFKDNVHFSLSRIKKLYLLHIITMCFAIVHDLYIFHRFGYTKDSIILLLKEIGLNVTLLQSWYPDTNINSSLNGVAWYLSTTMFLYFMFPWIYKIINKLKVWLLWFICGIVLILQIAVSVFFVKHLGMGSPVYIWFVYCFPIFRLFDLFIGACLGKTYMLSNGKKPGVIISTILEVVATVVTIAVFMWLKNIPESVILKACQNWTTIFIPIAVIWVYLFAVNGGLITKVLSNKLFIWIGNLSAFAFLIHYVITQYTVIILGYLKIELIGKKKAVIIFAELILTILISFLYKKLIQKSKE